MVSDTVSLPSFFPCLCHRPGLIEYSIMMLLVGRAMLQTDRVEWMEWMEGRRASERGELRMRMDVSPRGNSSMNEGILAFDIEIIKSH